MAACAFASSSVHINGFCISLTGSFSTPLLIPHLCWNNCVWALYYQPDEGTHATEKLFIHLLSYFFILANTVVKYGAQLLAALSLSSLSFS